MLELIKNVKNRTQSDIRKLSKSRLPLVMYGAGSYATDVSKFLASRNIFIDAYCVDEFYLKNKEMFINNTVITTIGDAYKKYPKFNIVIGFADYVKAEKNLKKYKNNSKIYFFDAPDRPNFFDYNFVKRHINEFQTTFNLLSDEESKKVFLAFINTKISGDPHNIYSLARFDQYFPDVIKFDNNESLIDCGAYDGDTIQEFVKQLNRKYDKIFAFEPDSDSYKRLLENIKKDHIKDVETYNKGCWSKRTVLKFSGFGGVTSTVSPQGNTSIKVDRIDNIVKKEAVSYIKMDIEGAELEALRGAKNVIINNRPKLAICVYHRPDDLITIPQYINSLVGDYDYYLRQHQYVSWDMVMYAVPRP